MATRTKTHTSKSGDGLKPGELSATTILSSGDNGTCYNLKANSAECDITLPTAANGLYYKFVVAEAFSDHYKLIASPTDSFEGSVIVAGAVVDVDAADTIQINDGTENIGDYIECWSDGSSWMVAGNFLTASAITAAG